MTAVVAPMTPADVAPYDVGSMIKWYLPDRSAPDFAASADATFRVRDADFPVHARLVAPCSRVLRGIFDDLVRRPREARVVVDVFAGREPAEVACVLRAAYRPGVARDRSFWKANSRHVPGIMELARALEIDALLSAVGALRPTAMNWNFDHLTAIMVAARELGFADLRRECALEAALRIVKGRGTAHRLLFEVDPSLSSEVLTDVVHYARAAVERLASGGRDADDVLQTLGVHYPRVA